MLICCSKWSSSTRLSLFTLLVALALTACVTEPERLRVRIGMSRDDLRSCFGEPLRIERAASGGEDWYYSFVGWSAPQVDAAASRDIFDPTLSTVSVSVSSSRSTQDCPVHLSADGFVVEPIPDGKIASR